jgi:hypothetical protein
VAFILLNVINPDLTQFKDFTNILPLPELPVTTDPTQPSKVDITVTPNKIGVDETAKVFWSGQNVTNCTGSGFETNGLVSGQAVVGPYKSPEQFVYKITCTGTSGAAISNQAILTVQ